mgnify:CR=1 FL=1
MPFLIIQPFARFLYMGWTDIIDILLVAYVIYKAMSLVRETRAVQLLKGIAILIIATQVSEWLRLNAINYLLKYVMQFGVLAMIIVFQPELRRALEKVGRSNIGTFLSFDSKEYDIDSTVNEICTAAKEMSESKTGALIVIERNTMLGEIINTGTTVNANVSAQLLGNLFFKNSPLHDGAVIIRRDKIVAASCYLPLTDDNTLNKELGTRHRAGIGISETADCAAIIVSEETGKISLALGGNLTRNLTAESLGTWLKKLLTSPEKTDKSFLRRVTGRWTKD